MTNAVNQKRRPPYAFARKAEHIDGNQRQAYSTDGDYIGDIDHLSLTSFAAL